MSTLWTTKEVEILRRLFKHGTKRELGNALPNRTWQTILRTAENLGLKREECRVGTYMPMYILHALRTYGPQTTTQLAERLGYSRTSISRYFVLIRDARVVYICKWVLKGGWEATYAAGDEDDVKRPATRTPYTHVRTRKLAKQYSNNPFALLLESQHVTEPADDVYS